MFESLEKVDWDLLHQQKLTMLAMRGQQRMGSTEFKVLSGIIHLVDALQDDAVADGRWIFPHEKMRRYVMSKHGAWSQKAPHIIYGGYPDRDLLPIEPPREGETIAEFKRRAEQAGDTLFLFLCREADDEIDPTVYAARLDRAIRDIESVREAVRIREGRLRRDCKRGEF